MIYLDYNATTPVAPEVLDVMLPFLREGYGNPSSSHAVGRRAHEAVEAARAQVAGLIGAAADEIIFTSGGTEATNLALRGVVAAHPYRRHVITSTFEHPATAETCLMLEQQRLRITRVPVGSDGRMRAEDVGQVLGATPALVTVMHANNEIGTIQPIAEISHLAKKRDAVVHTDAAQSLGKIPVNVGTLGVDLLTIAGHKLYAAKGVGALYARRGTALERVLAGAGHERGLRPGTENVAGIVGLGKACEIAGRGLVAEQARLSVLRESLLAKLCAGVEGLVLHGHRTERLPNTLFVGFPGVNGARLLDAVPEIAASTGSACHSGSDAPCASLLAIGVAAAEAVGPVRLSIGRYTTGNDVEQAAERLTSAWRKLHAAAELRAT
ncbi:MAG TPA: cysteine desulfurase family protein [Burkholderiales bacterium]|nr:cysteine desulfurase family protein [Burkholderiales bacterium]